MSQSDEWLTAKQAAAILRVDPRSVHRYAEQDRLTKRDAGGRRVLFSRESVARLADELAVDVLPDKQRQRADVLPASELLTYLRERDQQLADTQRRLESAIYELAQAHARVAQLESELAQGRDTAPRPWWSRLLTRGAEKAVSASPENKQLAD